MKIRVKEPESGMDLQIEIKLAEAGLSQKWLVTLPAGEAVKFVLADGKWLSQPMEKSVRNFQRL
jgi:hypothetical protein